MCRFFPAIDSDKNSKRVLGRVEPYEVGKIVVIKDLSLNTGGT